MISGELELDRLDELSDEEAIEEIVAVRGLGQWTAEMFLLFHLERPDVLSGGDLGIRKAVQIEYGLDEMPTPAGGARDRRALAAAPQPRLALPVGVAGRGPGRLTVVRRSFYLGLVAVALVAAGSVLAALLVRSNEIDHFHALQQDEALRSARQAEAVAELSVGELATAAAFFQAEEHFTRTSSRSSATRCCGAAR